MSSETIAAIATPPGAGGVGIVRISGPDAARIAAALTPDAPPLLPRRLTLRPIVDAEGALIDEALVVIMRAPNSYTGEDVVELQCHGGPVGLGRALAACVSLGARPARPGEFTERAFLNGRLDLTQAEAVADAIAARSVAAHKLAAEQLSGAMGRAIEGAQASLADAAVLLESAIDFSNEEHIYALERDRVGELLGRARASLARLLARYEEGRRRRDGVRVVVAGAPNAGKSTLFNALYGDERAIVTAQAGTTRDFLEEELTLGGALIRLIDTAGLRAALDEVERAGIDRARLWIERADLIVWVVDRSAPLPATAREALEHDEGRAIVALNKSDLEPGLGAEDEVLLARHEVIACALGAPEPEGLEALLGALAARAKALTGVEGALLSRERHRVAVAGAVEAIERAESALGSGLEPEFIAADVREALDALGALVGWVRPDEVLRRIFSSFCVGK